MACTGTCEVRRYRFRRADGDKTKVDATEGFSPPLSEPDLEAVLDEYFKSILVKECKTCEEGCECNVGNVYRTESIDLELPETIVATFGIDQYKIGGTVTLSAEYSIGVCTPKFHRDVDKKVEPAKESKGLKLDLLVLDSHFRPKAGTADCQCRCERQIYQYRPTAKTLVTPAAPRPDDATLATKLKERYAKDYPDQTLDDCNTACACLLQTAYAVRASWTKKIDPPIRTGTYQISGEFDISADIHKGVCVPSKLVLAKTR